MHLVIHPQHFTKLQCLPDVFALQGFAGDENVIDATVKGGLFANRMEVRASLPLRAACLVSADMQLLAALMGDEIHSVGQDKCKQGAFFMAGPAGVHLTGERAEFMDGFLGCGRDRIPRSKGLVKIDATR